MDDIRENNRRAPQNSESTIWILKYWVKRAKFVRKIRSQIAGLLEKMTNPYCNFCGINWGLRGETIENIEEIFFAFWRELMIIEQQQKLMENESKIKRKFIPEKNEKRVYETSDIIKWQQYFQKHATFRTICFECMNEVLETKKKSIDSSDKKNFTENINNTRTNLNVDEEKPKRRIKEILKFWLTLARNSKKP